MVHTKMHADEIETDASVVARLLAAQFPRWASLPVERFPSTGTENAIYRLGADLVVRMPLRPGAVVPVEKEWRWLPTLAPHLPLPVPVPLAVGEPGEGYPWRWSVAPWLRGENATPERIGNSHEAAHQLAGFIRALQRIDPTGGPRPGPENFNRGVPLAQRDAAVRRSIAALEALGTEENEENIDIRAAAGAWASALAAPAWQGDPVWLHGDLLPGNLLAEDGRLCGVIDFEAIAVGDPACDVMPAWTIFRGDARRAFRAALEVDGATWARGRGWALSQGLIALPYYRQTNPEFAASARRTIAEALADSRHAE